MTQRRTRKPKPCYAPKVHAVLADVRPGYAEVHDGDPARDWQAGTVHQRSGWWLALDVAGAPVSQRAYRTREAAARWLVWYVRGRHLDPAHLPDLGPGEDEPDPQERLDLALPPDLNA